MTKYNDDDDDDNNDNNLALIKNEHQKNKRTQIFVQKIFKMRSNSKSFFFFFLLIDLNFCSGLNNKTKIKQKKRKEKLENTKKINE